MPERTSGQALTQMKKRCYSEPGTRRRAVRRPEDVQRDVRGLKLRQRVTTVLQDDYIRNELEDTMRKHDELEDYETIRAYQDFLVPSYGGMPGLSAVQPINDIRGTDTLNYTKTERSLRCKLAASCRLIDLFGWSQNINGHVTARCPAEQGRGYNFVINPFGLLYNEVTASSLVKVDSEGNVVDAGSTNFGVSKTGVVMHSAIYNLRNDVKCAIYVQESSAVAVTSYKQGILPISQEALTLGKVSYHDYKGAMLDKDETEKLINDFPEGSKVCVLRNQGLLCVGETVEEAFYFAYYATLACQNQVKAMAVGYDNLIMVDESIQHKVYESGQFVDDQEVNTGIGSKSFEAWMRMLDAQGHRTGYVYHNPDLYNKTVVPPKSPGRSPATMTSYRYEMMFGDNQTPSRRLRSLGKGNTYKNRAKWLNTPVKGTEYKKEYIQDNDESTTLKDRKPEKERQVKILEDSKGGVIDANIIHENIIISNKPSGQLMSEIPLEDVFNEDDNVFVEKGINDAETKEIKGSSQVTKTEVTTIEHVPTSEGNPVTTKVITTTSKTVVENDGEPVTTVEEKVVVNGEEQTTSIESGSKSPPPGEVEEKADDGSDDGGDKEKEGDKEEHEGGKQRQKVKKRKSLKKSLQEKFHRKSKAEKDDEGEKS